MDFNDKMFENFLKQIKFVVYLDFANLCQHVLSPEVNISDKLLYIKEICKYLERPPKGKNIALCNQIDRKELLSYCQNYELGQAINQKIFHKSLGYAQSKLIEKKAVFVKMYKL